MLYFQKNNHGITFKVHIQPRASGNRIAGSWHDSVKIRLTAPPVDGEANKACIQFLSRQLKVPKSDIEIVSGLSSRTKKILVNLPDAQTRTRQADKIQKLIQAMAGEKTA